MAEGFKIASAYVEVRLKDETEADERRIRARLERGGDIRLRTVLEDPENVERVKQSVRQGTAAKLKVEAENPIDAAWKARVRASLRETVGQSLKVPLDTDSEEWRRGLGLLVDAVDKDLKVKIPADLGKATQFKSEVEALAFMASKTVTAHIPVEIDTDSPLNDAWRKKLQAQIRSVSDLALKIPVSPDTEEFRRDVDSALTRAKSMARGEIPLDTEAAEKFRAKLTAMVARAEAGVKARIPVEEPKPVTLKVTAANPIDAAWRKKIETALRATATDALKIPVTPETEPFIRGLHTTLAEAQQSVKAEIPVSPDDAAKFRTELDAMVEAAQASVKARIPADVEATPAKWKAQIRAALRQLDSDAAKIPVRAETAEFRTDLALMVEKIQRQLKVKIPAEPADAAKYRAELEAMVGAAQAGVKARIPVEIDDKGSIDRFVAKTNARFGLISFAVLSLGLPAAAAIGAAGATAAVAGVAASFVALSALALKSNDQVRNAYRQLKTNVVADTQAMAAGMQVPLIDAAQQVQDSFNRMKPLLISVFSDAGYATKELVGSVTDFAENAMPGLTAALHTSKGELQGFRSLTGSVGSGLTDMFFRMADGSNEAGQAMVLFGNITRDLLNFVGALLTNLSVGASGPLNSFRGALAQIESTLLTLTSSGMPLLSGATSGFLSTVSGGLAIVNMFAGALGAWSGPLGSLAGSLFATNKIASLFGTSLGATGFGLRAFSQYIDESGKKTTPFRQALAEAESGGTSKFRAGLSSVVSNGLNPLGLVLGLGSVLLAAWGKKAQDAAVRAQEHQQAVDDLTAAYMKDNAAIGANVQAVTQKALSDKNAFANSQVFGASLKETSMAALYGGDSLNAYNQKAKEYIAAVLSQNQSNVRMIPQVLATADAFAAQGGNAADAVDHLTDLRMNTIYVSDAQKLALIQTLDGIIATNAEARAQAESAKKAQALADAQAQMSSVIARGTTPAMYGASVAAADLEGAFEGLNKTAGDVAAKGQQIIDIMDALNGRHKSEEEALQKWNDDLRGIGDAFQKLNLKEHSQDLLDNTGAINTASEAGSKLQDVVQQQATDMAAYAQSMKDAGMSAGDITPKLSSMRDELAKQLRQLGLNDGQIEKVLQHYGLMPDQIVTTLGLEGDKLAQQKIRDVVSQLKTLPPGQSVELTANDKQAAEALSELGYHVANLPNGTFKVFANTAEGKNSADVLISQINQTRGTVTVYGNTTPAGSSVANWATVTNKTEGKTRTTTDIDPATGKVRLWKQTTDATGALTTTFATTDPATGAVRVWKMQTDGTWAEVHARADVAAAERAIDEAARNRAMTITVHYDVRGVPALPAGANRADFADGGVVKFFAGGGVEDGLTPMQSVARTVPPRTMRVVGDRSTVDEAYIPLDPNSARSQAIFDHAASIMRPHGSDAAAKVEQHFHIYPPVDSDPQRIAASVSSSVGWAMRGV